MYKIKNILTILILLAGTSIMAQTVTDSVLPAQDVYIANTTSGITTAYGTEDPSNLVVRFSVYNFARKSYLQFDLSEYADKDIQSVQLRMYGGVTANEQNVNELYTMIYHLPANDWNENEITWDTRPDEGSADPLDSVKITTGEAKYFEWNELTGFIKNQLSSGNTNVSFRVQNRASQPTPEPFVTFNSKEAASNQPELLITYTSSGTEPPEEEEPEVVLHPDKVQVVQTEEGNFVLYRGLDPYYIKGAGGQVHLNEMVEFGANSFRLWSTNEVQEESGKSPMELLDEAHELGLTVTLGLWVMHPRHSSGFYDDPEKVEQQFQRFREDVLKYKDHPALLMWAVGNEVHLETSETKVWDAVEDIVQMIKVEDPNHPVSTITADINQSLVNTLKEKVPSIDLLGINSYGNGQVNMPTKVRDLGWNKAYYMGESGPTNHWQVNATSWGAKYEPLNHEKAATYLNALTAFEQDETCVGAYVFKWGWKWQRTYSWINIFTPDGLHGEVADILHYAWKEEWPENRSPQTGYVLINSQKPQGQGITIEAESTFQATVTAEDPDGDELTYEWVLYPESTSTASGGDAETAPSPVEGVVQATDRSTALLKAPIVSGAYRLYVFVYDNNGHVSISNHPLFVEPKEFESTADSIFVSEDTYVRGGTYSSENYGQLPDLVSKIVGNESFTRETYLKFDISTITNPVQNAALSLYGIVGNGTDVDVFAVPNNTWSENSMTWDTKPPKSLKINTISISDDSEGYFAWDITSYVNSVIESGETQFSIWVQAVTETEKELRWNSKESGINPPVLTVAGSVTSVENNIDTQVYIYPNPASNVLNIKLNRQQPVQIIIYNSTGQQVTRTFERVDNGTINIDISNLPAGFYTLKVSGEETKSQKFIKLD